MDIPEDLEYALETLSPENRQRLIKHWQTLTEKEKEFVLMAINLDVSQEHFYEKRREQLGL